MTMFDSVVSALIVFVGGALLRMMWIRLWPPGKSAEDLGYIPGSETPEGGWLMTFFVAACVIGAFVFMFAFVGSAVFQ